LLVTYLFSTLPLGSPVPIEDRQKRELLFKAAKTYGDLIN